MRSKVCRACRESKPRSEYYAHYAMADGTLNQCKDCIRKYSRERARRLKLVVEDKGTQ